MAKIKIPKSPNEITNEWLTDIQRVSGRLEDAIVVNHSIKPLAIGIGSANIVRIILEYDYPEDSALSPMIAKFVSIHKKPHADELRDFSDREVVFYQHLGSNPGISIPQFLYAEIDEQSGDYLVLMEDMSKCRVGDLSGKLEDVEVAIKHLARFHAKWWNCDQLNKMPWGILFSSESEKNEGLFKTFIDSLLHVKEIYGNKIPETFWLVANLLQNVEVSIFTGDSLTLVHGDYHPGNIFFQSNNEGRFAVFDWEAVHNGCAGEDLARIITLGLTQEQRELYQDSLVKLYHNTLLEHVEIDYSLDQCWDNIRRGLLYSVLSNTISAARQKSERIEQLDDDGIKFILDIYFGRIDGALRSVKTLQLLQV
ncbi:MAG: DUF1679 domain-containing protein [Desulfobacteraceae bacterium]|jgi:hypothetical protein